MDQGMIVDVFGIAIRNVLMLSAPMLLTAMLVGLMIAVFQATTQIQEATLAFVPKVLGVFIVLGLAGPWMIQNLMAMTQAIFGYIDQVIL